MTPALSIVIVNWNTVDLLGACLESVFANDDGLSLEVVVVDNASQDGSSEMVRIRFPQVHLVQNTQNVGFAAANNQAFPSCTAPAVLLLNSDTIVRRGAFRTLLEFLAAHPKVGAVGPKVIHPRLQLKVLCAGRQPTLRSVANHYLFLSALLPDLRWFEGVFLFVGKHDDRPRRVEWLSGAALLVRREVITEVGPLDTKFFMYCEDQEWCDRIGRSGWDLWHVPAAIVEHHLNASTEKNPAASLLPMAAGREYYIGRCHPGVIELLLHDLVRCLGLGVRAVMYGGLGIFKRTERHMWNARARQYVAYARAASPLLYFRPRTRL